MNQSLQGIPGTPAPSFPGAAFTSEKDIGDSYDAFTLNAAASNAHCVRMTSSATMQVVGISDGQTINLHLTQSVGNHSITWPSNFKWPGGIASTLSTAAGAVDLLTATYRSRTGNFSCTLIKGIA